MVIWLRIMNRQVAHIQTIAVTEAGTEPWLDNKKQWSDPGSQNLCRTLNRCAALSWSDNYVSFISTKKTVISMHI